MSVFIVTYDLNKETVRPKIVDEIKKSDGWAKLSESSYAVSTGETPHEVYQRMLPFLDKNDSLFVITLSEPYYGQGTQDVIDWLAQHL